MELRLKSSSTMTEAMFSHSTVGLFLLRVIHPLLAYHMIRLSMKSSCRP